MQERVGQLYSKIIFDKNIFFVILNLFFCKGGPFFDSVSFLRPHSAQRLVRVFLFVPGSFFCFLDLTILFYCLFFIKKGEKK
jgi:hypothetical protein